MLGPELPQNADAIEWVLLSAITTDHRVNTRPINLIWVEKKLAEGFDAYGVGVPIVSHRTDGTYVWLDGQHRGELIRRACGTDQKVQCRVFTGLTLAEEARLFLKHNDGRSIRPLHRFVAEVTACDPDSVAINRTAAEHGWKVSEGGSRSIAAVESLKKVYQSDKKPDGTRGRALEYTLRVVTEAWGYKSEAVNQHILAGIGAVFNRFGDAVDKAVLVKKLAQVPSGPAGVLGRAKGQHDYQGGTVGQCVAEVVVAIYNRRRGNGGSLPDWR